MIQALKFQFHSLQEQCTTAQPISALIAVSAFLCLQRKIPLFWNVNPSTICIRKVKVLIYIHSPSFSLVTLNLLYFPFSHHHFLLSAKPEIWLPSFTTFPSPVCTQLTSHLFYSSIIVLHLGFFLTYLQLLPEARTLIDLFLLLSSKPNNVPSTQWTLSDFLDNPQICSLVSNSQSNWLSYQYKLACDMHFLYNRQAREVDAAFPPVS